MDPEQKVQEIETLFRNTYLIVDEGIIRLLLALYVAHQLSAKPVWLFLTAPSGSGKTEFINSLLGVPSTYLISSLTKSTFISGQRRSNLSKMESPHTSLLLRMENVNHTAGGIILFKDFTSLLSLNREDRMEIFAQMREIYDGDYKKEFGTGEAIHWKGKVSILAGVTTVIHTMDLGQAMGSRFVMYSPKQPDRIETTKRAMLNLTNLDEQREKIQQAVTEYIKSVKIPSVIPEISNEMQEELIRLANISTLARTSVERSYASREQSIRYIHEPEMPTRVCEQLKTLGAAFIVMNGGQELSPLYRNILYKVSLDCVPASRRLVLRELVRHEMVYTSALATRLNYPTETVRHWLEELNAVKLIDRIKESSRDGWKIKDEFRLTLSKFENIAMISEPLTDANADPSSVLPETPEEREALMKEAETQVELSVGGDLKLPF